MSKKAKQQDSTPNDEAKAFIKEFDLARAKTKADVLKIFDTGRFSLFEGGAVELTDELSQSLSRFASKLAKKLGPKKGNEKAIREAAMRYAQKVDFTTVSSDVAVDKLIEEITADVNDDFDFATPNTIIYFEDGIRSLTVGRVRAMHTVDLAIEVQQRGTDSRLRIVPGGDFQVSFSEPGTVIAFLPCIIWMVAVDAARDNVEEEAKWLIDVAVSLIRISFKAEDAFFPSNGLVEPHPIRKPTADRVGVKFRGTSASLGGARVPPRYSIGTDISNYCNSQEFIDKALPIFNPMPKSLSERVSQGLGWMTRGRQSEDRAERLLYHFTAIEALLSSDDKTAPVVQTIARHAAVIWSDDNDTRALFASEVRKLYSLRSALVHSGARSVLWGNANTLQYIAEGLFTLVVDRCTLTQSHTSFVEALSRASYGTVWQPA